MTAPLPRVKRDYLHVAAGAPEVAFELPQPATTSPARIKVRQILCIRFLSGPGPQTSSDDVADPGGRVVVQLRIGGERRRPQVRG